MKEIGGSVDFLKKGKKGTNKLIYSNPSIVLCFCLFVFLLFVWVFLMKNVPSLKKKRQQTSKETVRFRSPYSLGNTFSNFAKLNKSYIKPLG